MLAMLAMENGKWKMEKKRPQLDLFHLPLPRSRIFLV